MTGGFPAPLVGAGCPVLTSAFGAAGERGLQAPGCLADSRRGTWLARLLPGPRELRGPSGLREKHLSAETIETLAFWGRGRVTS